MRYDTIITHLHAPFARQWPKPEDWTFTIGPMNGYPDDEVELVIPVLPGSEWCRKYAREHGWCVELWAEHPFFDLHESLHTFSQMEDNDGADFWVCARAFDTTTPIQERNDEG